MTRDELIAFETDIAAEFNAGRIRAPIHLDGGNENQLIEIFKDIGPSDYVGCSWRSHCKALLKGVPPALVKAEIMAGRSIALCFPEHRFISSAIVGGIIPIMLGIAWSIKRACGTEKCWVFMGDMTACTGIACECFNYARGHGLPIVFVIEDNKKSVCSDTIKAWGDLEVKPDLRVFEYDLPYPHSGAGVRVQF